LFGDIGHTGAGFTQRFFSKLAAHGVLQQLEGGAVFRQQAVEMAAKNRWEEAIEANMHLINLGEDADTTGAIVGQLAGAYYGAQAIPARWLEMLAMRADIEELAGKLFERAHG